MNKKLIGQCHCGKNKFEVNAEPVFQFVCYCLSCRVLNSGHLNGMAFHDEALQKATETKTYSYPGGSGKPIILHFCPVCSVGLYAYPTAHENIVVVRANTLLNAEFKPQKTMYPESAFEWDEVKIL